MSQKKLIYYALVELEVPSGPSVHTLNVVKGFSELGFEVCLIAPKPIRPLPKIESARLRLVRFFGFSPARLILYQWLAFFSLVWEGLCPRPDLLLAREHHNFPAICAAWLLRIPLVVEVNGPLPLDGLLQGKSLFVRAWRSVYRRFQFWVIHGMTFNTPQWRDALFAEFKIPKRKSAIITMHVNTDLFCPKDKVSCRRQLGFDPEVPVLGYLGTFQPRHEIEAMFQMLQWLHQRGEKAVLAFIGKGNREQEARHYAKVYEVEAMTRFVGGVDHEKVPSFLNSCDVGLALSKKDQHFTAEAFLKVKEFLACEVPVVLSDHEQPFFRDYQAGALCFVPNHEPSHLGQAVLSFIRKPDVRALKHSREQMIDRYGLKQAALQTLALLEAQKAGEA